MANDLRRRPMRIAAGGFLLLAGVFDFLIALGHLLPGVFPTRIGWSLQGDVYASVGAGAELFEALGGPGFLGKLALVSAAVILIGAVSVFASQYPRVIYLACVVAIFSALREVVVGGLGVTPVVALAAAALGLISGLRIQIASHAAVSADGGTRPASVGDWLAIGAIVAGLAVLGVASYTLLG